MTTPQDDAVKAAKAAKQRESLFGLLFLFGGAALLIGVAYLVSLNPNGAVSRVVIYGCVGSGVVFFLFGKPIMRFLNRRLNR